MSALLERLQERNPALLEVAVAWHQAGHLPANCWLVDLDTVAANAEVLRRAQDETGLATYLMTKQHGRNPLITGVALARGLQSTVAVDEQCVRALTRYGLPVGHVGHLNQIPRRAIPFVLDQHPEVWTVYSVEHARWISAAAAARGRVQDLLLRVYARGDVFFDGQEGGFPLEAVLDAAREVARLPGVKVAGTVAFPCVRYNSRRQDPVEPTPNFRTAVAAFDRLKAAGYDVWQVNAPGNTSAATFPMLKQEGATHAEPGNGLLGTTPSHAFRGDLPEVPVYCYVTEITHRYEGRAYAHGGGLFRDIYDPQEQMRAIVAGRPEQIHEAPVSANWVEQIIDYHLPISDGGRGAVGDTVILGYRTQMHMTRSWVGVVAGLRGGAPKLVGLFDNAATMLDPETMVPLAVDEARAAVQRVVEGYRA